MAKKTVFIPTIQSSICLEEGGASAGVGTHIPFLIQDSYREKKGVCTCLHLTSV